MKRGSFFSCRITGSAGILLLGILIVVVMGDQAYAVSCEAVAKSVNERLNPKISESELSDILLMLNATKNRELPSKFVTKQQARSAGWNPGKDLWAVKTLKGKSIGGDQFGNFEKKLPKGKWREADLDYHGGKRGPKRIVYSTTGTRMVTVDHYQTFTEVPPCR